LEKLFLEKKFQRKALSQRHPLFLALTKTVVCYCGTTKNKHFESRKKQKNILFRDTTKPASFIIACLCFKFKLFFLVLSRRSDRVESTSLLLLGSAQLTVDSLNFVLQHLRTSSVLLHHLLLRRHV
jgi:hypothetical protein